jgi:hypothetical protein
MSKKKKKQGQAQSQRDLDTIRELRALEGDLVSCF